MVGVLLLNARELDKFAVVLLCCSDCGVGVENLLELIDVLEGLLEEERLLFPAELDDDGFPPYDARIGEVPYCFLLAASAAALLLGGGLLEPVEPTEFIELNEPLL